MLTIQSRTQCVVRRLVLMCSLAVLIIPAACSFQQSERANPTVVALVTQQAALKAQVETQGTIVSYLATRVGAQVRGTPTPIPTSTPYLTPVSLQATSTLLPTAVPVYPPGTRTGLPGIDAIIAAVLDRNVDAMRQLVHYTTTACTKTGSLGAPPPECKAGEAEGTRVEVLPGYGPESTYVRREFVDKVLRFDVRGLYAVYRVPENAFSADHWPAGQYGIIFLRTDGTPVTVRSDGNGIVRIDFASESPERVLIHDAGKILLPPS